MPIPLATLLQAVFPAFNPEKTKVHLAQSNIAELPLEVFYEGNFQTWQNYQYRRNFERDFVLSLIETPRPHLWLFAGVWKNTGKPAPSHETTASIYHGVTKNIWTYDLKPVAETEPLSGRLHVHFRKSSRGNYRLCETVIDRMTLSSIIEQPQTTPRFIGYRNVHLSMRQVRAIIATSPEDWQIALSSVGGVYLLTHRDGRHYVGSATGSGGFWSRWSDYARTGHGGNRRLIDLLQPDPIPQSEAFHLSILETADMNASLHDVLLREMHWKSVLGARAIGLNAN